MTKIFNTVDRVDGTPQSYSVLVELIWDRDEQSVAVHTDSETMCDSPVRRSCNNQGYWEIDIQSNDLIEPDSFYRVTHYKGAVPVTSLNYNVVVEDGVDPVWVGSILTDPPAWFDPKDWEEV